MDKLQKVIDNYFKKLNDEEFKKMLTYYKSISFEEALQESSFIRYKEDGKVFRHDHQFRIKKTILKEYINRLKKAATKIKNAKDFDALYLIIKSELNLKSKYPLIAYDIALRIGENLNIKPKHIYAQRGAWKGAKKLGLKREIGKPYLETSDTTKFLSGKLGSFAHVEVFLCIMWEKLNKTK